jgi:hypothetical protein
MVRVLRRWDLRPTIRKHNPDVKRDPTVLGQYRWNKGKIHPRTGHKGLQVEKYSSTPSLTSALDGVGGQQHAPAALTPVKTWYHRMVGGPQGRSGQVRKISPPNGIRSPDRAARSESLYRISYSCSWFWGSTSARSCSFPPDTKLVISHQSLSVTSGRLQYRPHCRKEPHTNPAN